MGQYHGRFADLPLSLREERLWLWDRPPIAESSSAGWIELGLASVAPRRRDVAGARLRLRLVRAGDVAALAARIEAALFEARLEMDAGRPARTGDLLTRTGAEIARLPPGR
ncbi:hypothetical protein [Streptomyces sp. NBC_01506]|uniref:hypothetical protein n=1 Tax=Streptomyces sp. NBC_01506 TaxID=2903887 RepID=UPI00386B2BB5